MKRIEGPRHISCILPEVTAQIEARCKVTALRFSPLRDLQSLLREHFPCHHLLELAVFDEAGLPYKNIEFERMYNGTIFDQKAVEKYSADIKEMLNKPKG